MPYLLSTDGSLAVQKDVKGLTAGGKNNVVRRMFVVNDPSFPPGTQRCVGVSPPKYIHHYFIFCVAFQSYHRRRRIDGGQEAGPQSAGSEPRQEL